MNNSLMFSSKTDLWATPQDFFDKLHEEFRFALDVCALPENAKCDRFFTPDVDGLKQEWSGTVWCNPPYGRQIGKWVEKCANFGGVAVMLLPARTDTKWFHDYISGKAEIRFVKGRLKFGGGENSAPFPSMVVIFRGEPADTALGCANRMVNEMTNADRIRAMTDEEIANALAILTKNDICMNPSAAWCGECSFSAFCSDCIEGQELEWLKAPAKEE